MAFELTVPPTLGGSTEITASEDMALEQTPDLGIALNLVVVVRLLKVKDVVVLEILVLLAQLFVDFSQRTTLPV